MFFLYFMNNVEKLPNTKPKKLFHESQIWNLNKKTHTVKEALRHVNQIINLKKVQIRADIKCVRPAVHLENPFHCFTICLCMS